MSEPQNHGDCAKCREIETDLCPRCRVCLDCCDCLCPHQDIDRDELARLVAVVLPPRRSRGSHGRAARTHGVLATLSVVASVAFSVGCSGAGEPAVESRIGGAVSGAVDSHCLGDGGKIAVATNPAACDPGPGAPGADATTEPYGDTHFNQAADDDDCKYHVSWSSTPVRRDQDVSFRLTASRTVDDQPLDGAAPWAEVFRDSTHPAPNTPQTSVEESVGLYDVGPIRFDEPGTWTVRFHLYSDCVDLSPDSPHAHVAFYIEVP